MSSTGQVEQCGSLPVQMCLPNGTSSRRNSNAKAGDHAQAHIVADPVVLISEVQMQKDSKAIKVVFWLIIGVACVTMVVTLVPGILSDQGSTSSNTYASIRPPGFLGRYLAFGSSRDILVRLPPDPRQIQWRSGERRGGVRTTI